MIVGQHARKRRADNRENQENQETFKDRDKKV